MGNSGAQDIADQLQGGDMHIDYDQVHMLQQREEERDLMPRFQPDLLSVRLGYWVLEHAFNFK